MKKSYIGCIIALAAAVYILIFRPFQGGMEDKGHIALAGMVITLAIWIFKPFKMPFSVGGIFMAAYMLATGLTAGTVFSGFTQSAIWTLMAALFFGFVLRKTGLGYRIALMVLKLIKPSYLTLTLAWALIGLILSVLTPSMTVRVAIMVPIAASCCQLCELPLHSKGNSLIMLTAFAMALVPGGGWLTGSLTGPVLQGAYNTVPELNGIITFDSWLKVSILPVEIAAVLMLMGALIFLKPKEPLPEGAAKAIKEKTLERISKEEIIAAVILVISFILFITGSKIGVSSTVVCLGATVLFFAFGLVKENEIGTAVSWDLIVFLGMALGLGNICRETGIIDWLQGLLVPLLEPFSFSPFVMMGVITLVLFIWHMVDIASYFPTMAILPAMLPAIEAAYGINPLVFAPVIALAGCAFFMSYQNHWAIMGQSVSKERSWTSGHLAVYGIIYCISSLIGVLATVPLWHSMGLL